MREIIDEVIIRRKFLAPGIELITVDVIGHRELEKKEANQEVIR